VNDFLPGEDLAVAPESECSPRIVDEQSPELGFGHARMS
jgi:hypothetical protein